MLGLIRFSAADYIITLDRRPKSSNNLHAVLEDGRTLGLPVPVPVPGTV